MLVCGRYLHVQWSDLWTTKPGVFFLVWIYFTNLVLCQLHLLQGSIESFPDTLNLDLQSAVKTIKMLLAADFDGLFVVSATRAT